MEAERIQNAPTTIRVRDIDVPTKPQPPGPEDCCQSGCVNCVYTLYADDMDEHREVMRGIRARLLTYDPPIRPDEWDTERLGAMPQTPDTQAEASEQPAAPSDPSLAAFLELERKLQKKT